MYNPLKFFRKNKVGLALGSGGSKGIAHISVIEYLEGLNIPIHYISGSSIGAIIGAIYSAGKLSEFKGSLLALKKKDVRSMFDPVLPISGLLKGGDAMKFVERFIPRGTNIEDLKIPLAIIATDFQTGKALVFKSGSVLDAIRASISIPGIFVPVKYHDTFLIDGGVANPLPVDVLKEMGAGLTIAVNLHPGLKNIRSKRQLKKKSKNLGVKGPANSKDIVIMDEGKKESRMSVAKGWLSSLEKILGLGQKDDTPNIFEIIMQSFDIVEYVNTMSTIYLNPPTVLIEPQLLDLGTMDFFKASDILKEGDLACERVKGAIARKIKFWV